MKINNIDELRNYLGDKVSFNGRVIKTKELGKNLFFYQIRDSSATVQVVSQSNCHLKKGDIIRVNGLVEKNENVRSGIQNLEVIVKSQDSIFHYFEASKNINNLTPLKKQRIHLLKSKTIALIRNKLENKGIFEVISPTIVTEAIEGPIPVFSINSPINKKNISKFLTPSVVLYHQELLAEYMSSIYEISKVFRGNNAKTSRHLAEILMLDISCPFISNYEIIPLVNEIVNDCINLAKNFNFDSVLNKSNPKIIEYVNLIDFLSEKTKNSYNLSTPTRVIRNHKKIVSDEFGELLWIMNKPETEGSFFKKIFEVNKVKFSESCELRAVSLGQIADGSTKEIDFFTVKNKLNKLGYDTTNFSRYLKILENGIPPNSGIGLGLDRLLMCLSGVSNINGVNFFEK